MKILVIGASSFSGTAFVQLARSVDCEVATLSRRDGYDLNVNLPQEAERMVRAGYDRVVNFAALNVVPASWDYAPDYYRTNVAGIARLARKISRAPLKAFVQVSTPEVYGTTQTFLRENHDYHPSTPYAISRAAADLHLQLLWREFGFPVCFTRTVNVYGPGQQLYRIIPKTALAAFFGRKLPLEGGGRSTRSFLHIRDVAAGILRVLEDGREGEAYHMASTRQTAIRELVAMVCERAGARFENVVEEAPERAGKDMAYQLDDSKIRGALGWSDTIPLEQGLDEVVAWVRAELPRLRTMPTEYEHRR